MSIAAVLANEQRWHVEVGHVVDGLRKLPDGCIQSVVTSPPYWNLRSYLPSEHPSKSVEIGSEKAPQDFVASLVRVFRELRRVLRADGTLWLNLGDSFATAGGKCFNPGGGDSSLGKTRKDAGAHPLDRGNLSDLRQWGVKDGDQMLMPHLVALAMREDGWFLRSTIIWGKKSPMPESVAGWRWQRCRVKVSGCGTIDGRKQGEQINRTSAGLARFTGGVDQRPANWSDCPGCDKCRKTGGYVLRRGKWRPTSAHEYIFLFSKSERYFCDGDAVQEPATYDGHQNSAVRGEFQAKGIPTPGREPFRAVRQTRNPRSVWMFSSEPERAKHFATFPSALPRKCLTAATSPAGCCPACGASYAPVVESERVPTRPGDNTKTAGKNSGMYRSHDPAHANEEYDAERLSQDRLEIGNRDPQRHIAVTRVTGYRPTCACDAGDPVPSLVCDIFSGSGTTGRVAFDMGLRYIGFELSEEYAAISREKIVRPFKKAATKKQRRPMKSQRSLWEVV